MTSSPSSTKSSSAISSMPLGDLGEVALERLLVLRLQVDAAGAPMCEAAEAIVLRLVLPARSRWEFVDSFGLHRREIERQRGRSRGHPAHRRYLATSPRNPPSRPGAQCAASHPATAAAAPFASDHGASSHVSHSPGAVRITGIAFGWIAATSAFGAEVRNPKRSARTGPSLTFRTEVQVAQMPAKKASGRVSSKANQTGGSLAVGLRPRSRRSW